MSDLVGNPEDRFSQNEAHMFYGEMTKKKFLQLPPNTHLIMQTGFTVPARVIFRHLEYKTGQVTLVQIVGPIAEYRRYSNWPFYTGCLCTEVGF